VVALAAAGPGPHQHGAPVGFGGFASAGAGLYDEAAAGAFGAATAHEDRVRAVRELPEVFQPAFSFR
jgi:hypothetical protein